MVELESVEGVSWEDGVQTTQQILSSLGSFSSSGLFLLFFSSSPIKIESYDFCYSWKRDSDSVNISTNPDTRLPILSFVAIRRRDTGDWAIPGVSRVINVILAEI